MLMSLTMRLRSKCPPEFWRARSVVAIPAPSFYTFLLFKGRKRSTWARFERNRSLYGWGHPTVFQIARWLKRRTLGTSSWLPLLGLEELRDGAEFIVAGL